MEIAKRIDWITAMYFDNDGVEHSERYSIETREDKYGQKIRLKCKCGIQTTWHTEKWQAEQAMYQLHSDKFLQQSS